MRHRGGLAERPREGVHADGPAARQLPGPQEDMSSSKRHSARPMASTDGCVAAIQLAKDLVRETRRRRHAHRDPDRAQACAISAASMSTMTLRAPRASLSGANAVQTRSSRAPMESKKSAFCKREVRRARGHGTRPPDEQRVVVGDEVKSWPCQSERDAEPCPRAAASRPWRRRDGRHYRRAGTAAPRR